MRKPKIKSDGRTITVRVPISTRKRGGKKVVLAPHGTSVSKLVCQQADNAMVKAIARGFRWRTMLETGRYALLPKSRPRNRSTSLMSPARRTTVHPESFEAAGAPQAGRPNPNAVR